VHCPRSHAFFGHRAFPFEELAAAGVNICLGTDSLATVSKSRGEPFSLNMFSEMRALAKTLPALSPRRILEFATLGAAKAIQREHQLGALRPDANADLIALPWKGRGDVYDAVLNHRGDVHASMIGGTWAIEPIP
jgi:cytosine/adenosine deaminase-related metal-dependent hydrolase